MDWSKAKRILIVSLLITNLILLGFIISSQYKTYDRTNSKDFREKTRTILESNNILVDCEIPSRSPRLNTLSVEFESYAPNRLNDMFFQGNGEIDATSLNVVQLNYNEEHINIINSRRLLYESTGTKRVIENLNMETALEYCQNFLEERGFSTSDMELSMIYEKNGLYHVEYSKLHGKYLVEKAFTNFILDSNGIKQMDRLWVEIKEESENKFSISSASKALLGLLNEEQQEVGVRKIIDIRPCYYFDPEAQGYIEDITKALSGRAIPGWRIVFAEGESVVIGDY